MNSGYKLVIVVGLLLLILLLTAGIPYLWRALSNTTLPANFKPPPGESPGSQSGAMIRAEAALHISWQSSPAELTGEVCVSNEGEHPTQGLVIYNRVQSKVDESGFQDLSGAADYAFPSDALGPGDRQCYPFSLRLRPAPNVSYRHAVMVTVNNLSDWLPGGLNCPGPELCSHGLEVFTEFGPPGASTPAPSSTFTATSHILPRSTPRATVRLFPTQTSMVEPTSTFTVDNNPPPPDVTSNTNTPEPPLPAPFHTQPQLPTATRSHTPMPTSSNTMTPMPTNSPTDTLPPIPTNTMTSFPTATHTPPLPDTDTPNPPTNTPEPDTNTPEPVITDTAQPTETPSG